MAARTLAGRCMPCLHHQHDFRLAGQGGSEEKREVEEGEEEQEQEEGEEEEKEEQEK